MAHPSAFNIFSCGRMTTANGGERLKKSASATSTSSPSAMGKGFLPRGIALDRWSSNSMKHSNSSPGNLRALADKPLTPVSNDVYATAGSDKKTFGATPPREAGQQRMRALVYNWPTHWCKDSLLQVTPGPVREPYELAVSYDLRARSHEFKKQKAYVVAFDVESLRRRCKEGMGISPLEVTNSYMSRDCCCSDVIPLPSSHGQVTVPLQITNTTDSELVILLRVVRSGNLRVDQDWNAIGDAVAVRVDRISDAARQALEEEVTAETMADEAVLSDESLIALGKEMDGLAKLGSLEELQQAEEQLRSTQERLAKEAEQRQEEYTKVQTQLQDSKTSEQELLDKLRRIENATAEAEQKLAKLARKKVG